MFPGKHKPIMGYRKMREFEGADFLGAYLALKRQICVPLCSTVKCSYPLTMSLPSHYRARLGGAR